MQPLSEGMRTVQPGLLLEQVQGDKTASPGHGLEAVQPFESKTSAVTFDPRNPLDGG